MVNARVEVTKRLETLWGLSIEEEVCGSNFIGVSSFDSVFVGMVLLQIWHNGGFIDLRSQSNCIITTVWRKLFLGSKSIVQEFSVILHSTEKDMFIEKG